MESNQISQSEVDSLAEEARNGILLSCLPHEMAESARVVVIHPEYWEVSLLVPYNSSMTVKAAVVRKIVEGVLFEKCGVNPDWCDYLGKRDKKKQKYDNKYRSRL